MHTPRRPSRLLVLTLLGSCLLLLPACFDVPLGDPASSRLDPRLVGYWDRQGEDGNGTIVAVAAFDDKAYLLAFHNYTRDGEKLTPADKSFHKAWITVLKDTPFLTIQPMHELPGLDDDAKPAYVLAKLTIEPGQIIAHGLKPDAPALKSVASPADLATAVTTHQDDAGIYEGAPSTYRKLDPAHPADRRLLDIVIEGTLR